MAKPRLNLSLPQAGYLLLLVISTLILLLSPGSGNQAVIQPPVLTAIARLIGLVYLVCGAWIFVLRRGQAIGQTFILFTASTALCMAGLSSAAEPTRPAFIWALGLSFASASLVDLALTLFTPTWSSLRTRIRIGIYSVALLLSLVIVLSDLLPAAQGFSSATRLAGSIFSAAAMLTFLILTGIRDFARAPYAWDDSYRLLSLAAILSFVPPMLGWIGSPFWSSQGSFSPWWLISLLIFAPAAAFAIQSRTRIRSDFLTSRLALYGLLFLIIVGGYALLVTGLSLLFPLSSGPAALWIQGAAVFSLALAILPVRNLLQSSLQKTFSRSRQVLDEQLELFITSQSGQVDLSTMVKMLRQSVETALAPSGFHIFLYDPLSEQYTAAPAGDGRPSSDFHFGISSHFLARLSENPNPVSLEELFKAQTLPAAETARLKLLGAVVLVPVAGPDRLAGWLAIAPHRSGEPYTTTERTFLQSLARHTSQAIERAQVVEGMENRVREMNVLGRVAQGVNITLQMDDIFELIYAQTTQIIQAEDFFILLLHPETGELLDTFHVENDDRLSEKEQKNIAKDQFLEEDVARTGRSLQVDDYAEEAHRRGLTGVRPGVKAWMAVPLNAGAGSIGVISLGRRDPTTTYSREQLNLLQRIADQAAGAIVKARLLAESERRTHQLTTLNEVTRQLTSTLDLEPLLSIILDSASELLNCEAGSLLLVDPQTDELVFRVVTGPAKKTLTGKRMPPGAGVVGKAVQTRLPIIVSDVQSSPDWFKYVDEQTGFITRALLVIPLEVKGNIIGVIEVINKRGSSSFTREDQNLLSAFASQAGIAIENARLYTNTDQALAARVEELSVMQRIDRELNASLEINRAFALTLEWALRQSHSPAGLIGQLQDGVLHILSANGYANELDSLQGLLTLDHFFLQQVVDTASPLRINLEGALLPVTRTLALIPIRREDAVFGIILLESPAPDALDVNTMAFLTRLSDHASIAISNAQLYAEVQAANVAKSEFVSFVSHELKNPMTSIKGYTELLAAGAVGTVNEAQANFLTTIRSNVERMSTLVSDLNDVSRIEANRMRFDFKAQVVNEVVEETIRSLRKQIDEKGQQLVLHLPADLPNVWADRTRLGQVMVNLVSNAHKYTTQGGTITVAAEIRDNEWDPAGARRVVHLSVQDTGIGISPEDQKKIFQKFFRSEDPKTREAPGTGLGLNITRSLVEMQGGKIWFESEFRVGTTFHITIPIAE